MRLNTKPYGLWDSPLTPTVVSKGTRLNDVCWDTEGHALVWLEGRSDRGVIVVSADRRQAPRDLTSELSVRAKVGYGGGDLGTGHAQVVFSAEGRLFRQSIAYGDALPITPAFGQAASPKVSPDGAWVLYVHSYENSDCLAMVDIEGASWPSKVARGADFYMQPAWHPNSQTIAWISWNHPNMPWDGTTLELAELSQSAHASPTVQTHEIIAGDANTSIMQPEFSPDGRYLSYLSDQSGWYGIYLFDLQTREHRPLVVAQYEIGSPAWVQGIRTYAWAPDSQTIYYCGSDQGFTRLYSVNIPTGASQAIGAMEDYSDVSQIAASSTGELAMIASSPSISPRVITLVPETGALTIVARSTTESMSPDRLSTPRSISWPSSDETDVYGLFYGPAGETSAPGKPPLIVFVHGGPTGQSSAAYSARNQFFTTRGYAVLDVNYRGSSGFGRPYRNLLRENWGVLDVEDAVGGARYVADQGWVNQDKLVIAGGSAGGFTVLAALIQHPGFFKAGLCLYGVTNLFTLAADTHKFEMRYLDHMVGTLPEQAERYRQRSPIYAAERIQDPIAIFQGEEDPVVPKAQAETIVNALRARGITHEYHLYEGEGHGWRKKETIEQYYNSVVSFLREHVIYG